MPTSDARLQRLDGLAHVWSDLYFYHPSVTVPDDRWEDLLLRAIPAVEAAGTPAAYAAALDDAVLQHLDDPRTRAVVLADPPAEPVADARMPSARLLADGTGYLDPGNGDVSSCPDLPSRLSSALETVRYAPGLVLDLRTSLPPHAVTAPQLWPTAFGFFLDAPLRLPGRVERVHHGWNEGEASLYQSGWKRDAGGTLTPVTELPHLTRRAWGVADVESLPRYEGPLAVLVDDESYGRFEPALAALQIAGRAHLVYETDAGAPAHADAHRLWGDVEVRMHLFRLAASAGVAEPSPDRTVALGSGDAVATAQALLRAGSPTRLVPRPLDLTDPPVRRPGRGSGDDLPTREQRLLALFKIWAVLGEFSPHLEFVDVDWAGLLPTWIPRAEAVTDAADWCGVLLELASHLNDSHVSLAHPAREAFLCREFGTHVPALRLRTLDDDRAVIEHVENNTDTDAAIGMEVTHVNGRPITEILAERSRYTSASTPQSRRRRTLPLVLAGAEGSSLTLTIKDDKASHAIKAVRSQPMFAPQPASGNASVGADPDEAAARWVDEFGYLDLTSADRHDVARAFEMFADAPGVVLDMRGYPRCVPRATVLPRLIERACPTGDYYVPLRSASRQGRAESLPGYGIVDHYVIQPDPHSHFAGAVAVLIDERAISQSEDFCICLRNAGRATFVGGPTAGTNGNVTWIRLPGMAALTFTGMRVTYADGSRFQNLGIQPDIFVQPSPGGLTAGRDEVLDAATEALRSPAPPRLG